MNAPRSGCPINLTLEALGDRWSLIVIRDLMFGNRRHFRELLTRSEERIASNILADRLTRLEKAGLVSRRDDPSHKEGGVSGSFQLIENAYKDWTFDDMDFLENLRKRGVDDPQKLPYYPYRDDGQLIWDCLGNYVKDYLGIYYLSDEDVTADYELQNWAKQLSGHLDSASGLVPGFPNR